MAKKPEPRRNEPEQGTDQDVAAQSAVVPAPVTKTNESAQAASLPEQDTDQAVAVQSASVPVPTTKANESSRAVSFGELHSTQDTSGSALPRSLLDPVAVKMSVELGHVELTFRELQNLPQGAIVELDHMMGDPLEIRVNGHLIARGEVVSVKDERYGIRITEVVREPGVPESGNGHI